MPTERLRNRVAFWEMMWKEFPDSVRSSYGYELLPQFEGKRVLDIGCGDAYNSWLLEGAHYVGVDISRTALESTRDRDGKSEFYLASATHLPFKDNSFDVAISMETITLLGKDANKALEEMRRVAGQLVFTVSHNDIGLVSGAPYTRSEFGTLFSGENTDWASFTEDDVQSLLGRLNLRPNKIMVFTEDEIQNWRVPIYETGSYVPNGHVESRIYVEASKNSSR